MADPGFSKSRRTIWIAFANYTYRLIVTSSLGFIFALFDLLPQIFNIYTLIILWDSAEFVVEPSILKHTERKHICRRYDPHVPCIYRICIHLEKTRQVLRSTP
jgi:hypothetical protein